MKGALFYGLFGGLRQRIPPQVPPIIGPNLFASASVRIGSDPVDNSAYSGRVSIQDRTSEARQATRPGPRWRCRGNKPSTIYL